MTETRKGLYWQKPHQHHSTKECQEPLHGGGTSPKVTLTQEIRQTNQPMSLRRAAVASASSVSSERTKTQNVLVLGVPVQTPLLSRICPRMFRYSMEERFIEHSSLGLIDDSSLVLKMMTESHQYHPAREFQESPHGEELPRR